MKSNAHRRKTDQQMGVARTWRCCDMYFFKVSNKCPKCKRFVLPAALPIHQGTLKSEDMMGWHSLTNGGKMRVNHI